MSNLSSTSAIPPQSFACQGGHDGSAGFHEAALLVLVKVRPRWIFSLLASLAGAYGFSGATQRKNRGKTGIAIAERFGL